MFGGTDGLRRIMSQDTVKPRNARQTLGRLAGYFKPYWLVVLLVAGLLIGSTWAQVRYPNYSAPLWIATWSPCRRPPRAPHPERLCRRS